MTEEIVRLYFLSSCKCTFFDGSEWGVGEGRNLPTLRQVVLQVITMQLLFHGHTEDVVE